MRRKFVSKQRTAHGENKVTLFPFLAVLLCTMGALIMLLVVIARNVREQNVTVANPAASTITVADQQDQQLTKEQAAEILEQIKMGTEEAEWFAENWNLSKKEAEKTLAEKQTQLALAEKATQKVHEELERLAGLIEQLERNEKENTNNVAELKSLLEQRKRQQQKEELELAELQKEIAKDTKSYAIIPYRGTAGTYRRPIYIECRNDKVIIQPEGVELTEADFLFANRPDNPLDTVLRVVRQYYMETNQMTRGTEPYPLLIVRPSGVAAYEATRRAVGTWIREFGYELVEENSKIEYPKPSEELKTRIEKQLEISRYRLAGYLNAIQAEHSATARAQQYRLDHRGNVLPSHETVPIPRNRLNSGNNNRNNNHETERNGRVGGTDSAGSTQSPAANYRRELPHNSNNNNNPDPDVSLIERRENNGNNPIPDHSISSERNKISQPNPTFGTQIVVADNSAPIGQSYSSEYFPQQQLQQQGTSSLESPASISDTTKTKLLPTDSDYSNNRSNNNPKYSEQLKQFNEQSLPQSGTPMTGTPTISHRIPETTQNRADNWALRDAMPFATAVSRNIKIQCEANQYVLVPQTGLLGVRVIPITTSVQESTDKLVTAIWEFMDSWGIAGENLYWRPVLQIKVLPGGEQRFQELKLLLRNSGLIIVNSE
ncbi:MAG: hypothetical protein LBI18_09760 [Planctomycetaceae bacterium]|jgi:hypothetical protein|nr:hypothetical protein [Planctomycetaceae bacterium]